jgi:hypothetical protein
MSISSRVFGSCLSADEASMEEEMRSTRLTTAALATSPTQSDRNAARKGRI